jgi:hypothetical protein
MDALRRINESDYQLQRKAVWVHLDGDLTLFVRKTDSELTLDVYPTTGVISTSLVKITLHTEGTKENG